MKIAPLRLLGLVVSLWFIIALCNSVQGVADGDAPGVISIDCGVTLESRDDNNFYYKADDDSAVEFGQVQNVSPEYVINSTQEQVWKPLNTLRSFPEGKRNCYSLKPEQGKDNNYLIRAYYMYGNYDNKNSVPEFEFHLGVNFWTESYLDNVSKIRRQEVIHVSPTNSIDVCLINTGKGTPFISLLELWPLKKTIYHTISTSLPLGLMTRSSFGMSEHFDFIRYPEDIYGRSWFKRQIYNSETINATTMINSDEITDYKLPSQVLSTAIQSQNGSSSLFIPLNFSADHFYYVYLHFFDFVEHSQNQLRKMDIYFNDPNPVSMTLKYQELQTVQRVIPKGVSLDYITITSSPSSGIPPMINAYEVYGVLPQPNSTTDEGDVYAMWNIKHAYNIQRISWQGDPCMPSNYSWEGVNCNYSESIPRVNALNMSSRKLKGDVDTHFSNLLMLESLDLSNNQLTGNIPQFLAKLLHLRELNLTGNNLTGSIPKALWEKSRIGLLLLSLDGNPGLCQKGSCKTITKKSKVRSLVASVAASVAVLVIIVYIFMMLYKRKRRKQNGLSKKDEELKSKYQAFCQFEVLSITNDFESVIGEGGFGKVYRGKLQDGTQVAVKLLSMSSSQGFNEFLSEAKLLTMVYHKNLVSLVGYCNDGDMRALVYEYMAKGNLRHQLSDKNPYVLKWNERLQIAFDAACGLDYLHNGCKPPIIHRDLKTSNILLSESMQAKIADFGLSKAFSNDIDTHISTRPAGTFGYLDPEFYRFGNLNKKSDVYSFGIILFELITGQPAIIKRPEGTSHIADWVTSKLEVGDIQSIMDPRLEGKFNTASAQKLLEIAKSCIQPTAIQKPDISFVEIDLKQCLALETSLESAESISFISSTTLDTSYSQCGSHSPPPVRTPIEKESSEKCLLEDCGTTKDKESVNASSSQPCLLQSQEDDSRGTNTATQ